MSGVPTKQIDGDVAISRHASIGGRARVRGSARVDHNLRVEGWLDAPNIKGVAKGLFGTLEELKGSYPHPEAGWWALVGDTLPAALYVAKEGEWEATGKSAGEPTVDCETYLRETEALQEAVDELGADVGTLQTEMEGVKGTVTNLSTRVGNLETGLRETQTSLDDFKGSVGKVGGIAPLGTNRMVPSRYMLPELYNVVEFDGMDDTAASEIGFAEGGFQAPVGEEYETHIVWLSAIGRFAAMFRRKDGVGALSLDSEDASAQAAGAATEAGGSVGGAETGGGDIIAAGKYYRGWDHSERYCDEDGKPLAGKLYRSYGDGALYAATRDCQDLERLYADLLAAAERGFIADRWCDRCFGLGDISEDGKGFTYLDLTLTHDEAMKALLLSGAPTELSHGIAPSCAEEMSPRVFLPFIADCSGGRSGLYKAFDGCATTERVKLIDKGNPEGGTFRPSTLFAAFRDCGAIDRIELDLCFIDSWQQVYCAFSGCTSLTTLRLKNLRVDLDLSDSPALSYDSVKFLIDNAANEEAVTVTLASGLYALIIDEASGEWHALLSKAAAKGIYFATN